MTTDILLASQEILYSIETVTWFYSKQFRMKPVFVNVSYKAFKVNKVIFDLNLLRRQDSTKSLLATNRVSTRQEVDISEIIYEIANAVSRGLAIGITSTRVSRFRLGESIMGGGGARFGLHFCTTVGDSGLRFR